MKYRRMVMLAAVLLMAGMVGCVSTPEGPKLTPEGEATADAVIAKIEEVKDANEPWLSMVPFGPLIIGAVSTALVAYKKFQPYVTANREIIAGVQAGKQPDANLRVELAAATSDATKLLIKREKVKTKL